MLSSHSQLLLRTGNEEEDSTPNFGNRIATSRFQRHHFRSISPRPRHLLHSREEDAVNEEKEEDKSESSVSLQEGKEKRQRTSQGKKSRPSLDSGNK